MGNLILHEPARIEGFLIDVEDLRRRELAHEREAGIDLALFVSEMFVECEDLKIGSGTHGTLL